MLNGGGSCPSKLNPSLEGEVCLGENYGSQGNRILFRIDASRHSQTHMDQEVKNAQIWRKSVLGLQSAEKNSVLRFIHGILHDSEGSVRMRLAVIMAEKPVNLRLSQKVIDLSVSQLANFRCDYHAPAGSLPG